MFSGSDPAVLNGKVALLKKGLFFCREQVKKAVVQFQTILHGDDVESTDQPAKVVMFPTSTTMKMWRVMVAATMVRPTICLRLS